MEPVVYQVSEFTRQARELLEEHFGSVWLTGEISNLATPASGHIYFSLKDESAQIRCAMFRNRRSPYRGELGNGTEVLLSGTVSLYEARGDFQLIVDYLEPAGEGELRRRFELLKKRLTAEGLFDPAKRRPLPDLPGRIAVITSGQGAALQDILTTLERRFPLADVLVLPVPVQGDTAAPQIVETLRAVSNKHCDVAVLARGGGSLEDLWAFNEETVVRAIRRCKIPVVTGVGHETDFTLADFAADLRCATPTAAAESVSPDAKALADQLLAQTERLGTALDYQLQASAQRLDSASARLRHPSERLSHQIDRLESLGERLRFGWQLRYRDQQGRVTQNRQRLQLVSPRARLNGLAVRIASSQKLLTERLNQRLAHTTQALAGFEGQLKALSPLATLDRGFAIVQLENKKPIVRSASALEPGDTIVARFARGSARAKVKSVDNSGDSEPS
ncbi:MAG TPA: exodeoxyribonuclease VII large subunit [Gammaproteobacteria bacterium]|jgi:exodeoxyribonuclease VII large subunit|nr:exodeoxyribonuclease VII large subunit [Arenicellales bacterium]MDP6551540.1 exodeoxyribonuclease VII large subunit [Arenicellales bacterium]MDP6790946.1 exodeoxyribonuclease VII large subunit [Arenicellales bacterium]MDP6918493.1 exodeoxyribonuclease VII large subunit [Arenicellales bacterium]HCX87988.1 exodeoxyribonuclease VII large subunit [Gammaproteobacteria bacterium]|tara:strand:+ start:3674 stop:5020 length:1347 start_codon:yes stop_codon:yes gene_type:complete